MLLFGEMEQIVVEVDLKVLPSWLGEGDLIRKTLQVYDPGKNVEGEPLHVFEGEG